MSAPAIGRNATAFAAETDALKKAADAAPADAGKAAALADHLMRYRDPAARRFLARALVTFPKSQVIHVQYLYATSLVPANWAGQKRLLPADLAKAITTPADPDPHAEWVRRFAILNRHRPADPGSPLGDFRDFSSFAFKTLLFPGVALPGAKFADAHITTSNFRAADLSGADLRWSELDQVDLSFARLTGADLSDWNPATRNGTMLLRRLNRQQVAYQPPWLLRLMMPTAVPAGVPIKLLRATLDHAKLDRATLIRSDLRQASFDHASLKEADLREADLRGADFTGADLTGALLTGVRFDCDTKWPDGFHVPARSEPDSLMLFCRESIVADAR